VTYGRAEISKWLDGYIERYGAPLGDPFTVSPEALYMVMAGTLGWEWDIDDVGRAPHPMTGEASAFSGLYKFLRETMAAKKLARDAG
jgi:hypothetical protein